MARALVGATNNGAGGSQIFPGGQFFCSFGLSAIDATFSSETAVAAITRKAGSFNRLAYGVATNTLSTAAVTINFRKNGTNGNGVISISAGITGFFFDTNDIDTVASGDTYDASVTAAAGGTGGMISREVHALFLGTLDQVIFYAGTNNPSGLAAVSATRFYPICGDLTAGATENNAKVMVDLVTTLSDLQVYVSANTKANAVTIRVRKNNANGNQSVSIAGTTTGWFEDNSNTDVTAVNDTIDYSATTGTGTGITSIIYIGVTSVEAIFGSKSNIYSTNPVGNGRTASGTRSHNPIFGRFQSTTSNVETDYQIEHNFNGVLSLFRIFIVTNTYTGTALAGTRVNGADGNSVVSISAGTTGQFTDAVNSDTFQAADKFVYYIKDGTSGTMTTLWFSALETTSRTPGLSLGYTM